MMSTENMQNVSSEITILSLKKEIENLKRAHKRELDELHYNISRYS